ncbi:MULTISPECIES: right-handed parallel beta-helix repeat-containing protein [Caproicibacterium]|uniref:Right-handed parallel beta-helix repeat-containing protein n=1 Tax=Caproicibacterium argilliputei TaxID=3030016 RepID=A0AA97H2Q3_9FIRM|nr:right-handed parallel beta-helix repeat-containing protein [Caproicibacterium argilliputei]WOC32940.1 right-handed parallel beta-helix repeat-containing protein [Caproicibacterium argilliputei]
MREYHVAKNGSDFSDGTQAHPFLTISKAAALAMPGDCVIVHAGVYREWVKPEHSGRSDAERIVYTAAPGEKVVIKGSEQIKSWQPVEGDVWKAVLPNSFFGSYNPYKETLGGDWFIYPADHALHPGDVYLNGKSFYEASSLEEVKHPQIRTEGYNPPWTKHPEKLPHPEDTVFQWYTESDEESTTIYANFQGKNPNEELTEINVRRSCFYPERIGRNYITVRGFEMAQAACPWTPPTADQPGLLGTHWSKGWIIEQNVIHDAKCSGISIGKEASTGHNLCTRTHRKPGYQYQMEAVFRARQTGWSKETIGSHIIRNNEIYDCGQNGIVGHMGCVFSKIYHNHIHDIAVKHEFFGYEIAGIKLHVAIDVQIFHNNIHNCTLGTWLDWQAQGTRVSKNLYYQNDRDLMVEVSHGPYLVDNNIFASAYNFDNLSQGGAYVHNLCCGTMRREDVLDRSTPYHFPHSTEVAGTTVVYGGDDRLYQNIFLGSAKTYTEQSIHGTEGYNGHLTSLETYIEKVMSLGNGDLEQFQLVKQPVYINGNAYLNGAKAFREEADNFVGKNDPAVRIVQDGDETYLEFQAEQGLLELPTRIYGTANLGSPRITEEPYENPDGTPIVLDTDYFGHPRKSAPIAGPIENLRAGANHICVWSSADTL